MECVERKGKIQLSYKDPWESNLKKMITVLSITRSGMLRIDTIIRRFRSC